MLPDIKQIERSEELVNGMKSLKEMDLLTGKGLNHTKFPGVIKVEHIYNDYHPR
jgi:hypothetical protein